jgi:hypothetical protein
MITISHVLIHLRDDYTCQLCNEEFSPLNSNLEVDHIFPKSYAFFSHPYNLQALCNNCNYEKFNFLEEVQPVMILNAYEKSNKYWNDDGIDKIWDQLALYYDDYRGNPPGLTINFTKDFKLGGKIIKGWMKKPKTEKELKEDNFVNGIKEYVKTNNSKHLMPIFNYCMYIKKQKEDDPKFLNILPRVDRSLFGNLNPKISGLLEKTYIKKAEEFDDPIIQNQWISEYRRVKDLLLSRRMR